MELCDQLGDMLGGSDFGPIVTQIGKLRLEWRIYGLWLMSEFMLNTGNVRIL